MTSVRACNDVNIAVMPRSAIDTKPAWAAHLAQTHDVPVVSADDVTWADGIAFGAPSRFGNVAAQLKQFIEAHALVSFQVTPWPSIVALLALQV